MRLNKLFLCIFLSLTASVANISAQGFYVYQSDGSRHYFLYNQIDSLVFNEEALMTTTAPRAVDLGLSVKWASCNLGADSPDKDGHYYAWGEVTYKEIYNWETYTHCDGTESTPHDIGTDISRTDYDAAYKIWNSAWRMPTQAEVEELRKQCIWTWISYNGTKGYKVTGPNGNYIFLPASGNQYNDLIEGHGSSGYYWTSTLSEVYKHGAYGLFFSESTVEENAYRRRSGHCIRPVVHE